MPRQSSCVNGTGHSSSWKQTGLEKDGGLDGAGPGWAVVNQFAAAAAAMDERQSELPFPFPEVPLGGERKEGGKEKMPRGRWFCFF